MTALDVMVLVDLGLPPVGDLVGLAVPGEQGLALLVLEDHQGLPVSGAVDAQPSHVAAPAPGLLPDIGQVSELAALEETLPGIGNATLHFGLVLGMARPGRVGDEAAALGVLQETPGEDGMQRVRRRHRGWAIVDDQVLGDAAEEGPGRFQPGDHVVQRLPEGGPAGAGPENSRRVEENPRDLLPDVGGGGRRGVPPASEPGGPAEEDPIG